jgi:hypothetical protein
LRSGILFDQRLGTEQQTQLQFKIPSQPKGRDSGSALRERPFACLFAGTDNYYQSLQKYLQVRSS